MLMIFVSVFMNYTKAISVLHFNGLVLKNVYVHRKLAFFSQMKSLSYFNLLKNKENNYGEGTFHSLLFEYFFPKLMVDVTEALK